MTVMSSLSNMVLLALIARKYIQKKRRIPKIAVATEIRM